MNETVPAEVEVVEPDPDAESDVGDEEDSDDVGDELREWTEALDQSYWTDRDPSKRNTENGQP